MKEFILSKIIAVYYLCFKCKEKKTVIPNNS